MQYKHNITGAVCRAWNLGTKRPPWVNIELYLCTLRQHPLRITATGELPTAKRKILILYPTGQMHFIAEPVFHRLFTPLSANPSKSCFPSIEWSRKAKTNPIPKP